jgi:FkbM family methyltransferase
MKFSVVIPTYNHCDDLLKPCIESILKHTDLDQIELIVVANGCTDTTESYVRYVADYFGKSGTKGQFKGLWVDRPIGYAPACNLGIQHSTGDVIVLLNNDTVLLDQPKNQWLDLFGSALSDQDCGIACVMKGFNTDIQRSFAVFFCVAIRQDVFEVIGLLDEAFEVGAGEDTDFCIRAEEAGFEVREVAVNHLDATHGVAGSYPIYHKGEGTVHDPKLVKDWDKTFKKNSERLVAKYNLGMSLQRELEWLCEIDHEAKEHYNEVVVHNIYGITKEKLKDHDVVDIGANIGTFSLMVSKICDGKVISVEPVSNTFNVFKSNIARAESLNIIPLQAVAASTSGDTVKIGLHDKSGHNNIFEDTGSFEEIKTLSFKDIMKMTERDKVFLKMDCEGGEYDILLNADPEDMAKVDTVAIEIHGDLHPTIKGVDIIQNKLKEFGFTQLKFNQIGAWDGVDSLGHRINYRDIPITQEIWGR